MSKLLRRKKAEAQKRKKKKPQDLPKKTRLPSSLLIQPLTAFAILSYRKRDFAEAEGLKTDRGKMHVSPKGRWEGQKISHWTRTA